MTNTLAIDIGGTKVAMAVFEGSRLIRRDEWPTDREHGHGGVLPQVVQMARKWQTEMDLVACGVGFGGPVDFDRQRVSLSTHVRGWDDFPLSENLEDALGIPAIIDNDANVAALGEAKFGAGRDAIAARRPMFYMTVSTGIGGGLVLGDGTVYRGANSWAAEIGHMTIRPDGPDCLCGSNGCLERMCSGLWIEKDYERSPIELFDDSEFVKKYVIDLALGIKAGIMILNPACVVIGGGITRSGDRLFDPLRKELQRQMPPWSKALIDIRPAALGDDHVLWGALELTRTLT